jgi:broad specificity phosphatase PhoE
VVADVVARHPDEHPLLVSHGGAIWAAVARILGVDWPRFRSMSMPGNASLTHIQVGDRGQRLVDFNLPLL